MRVRRREGRRDQKEVEENKTTRIEEKIEKDGDKLDEGRKNRKE